MSYTSSPYAPKARFEAAKLVLQGGLKKATVARMYGVHKSTVSRWIEKFPQGHKNFHNDFYISTASSAPKTHPNQTPQVMIDEIIQLRKKLGRCAPVIHAHLVEKGYSIHVRTVGRILKREGLTRRTRQAKYYKTNLKRPQALKVGDLVQMDTIHYMKSDGTRFYLYCLIDVYSRLAYVEYHPILRQNISFEVIKRAQKYLGFNFTLVQTDNRPEFKDGFLFLLSSSSIKLRHSRVRKPNDNAHIERFNRTIQDECFNNTLPNEKSIKKQIINYLDYYNNFRLHLSLNLQAPTQFVAKVLS